MKDYRLILTKIYENYNPAKLGDIEELLLKNKGHEELLLERIVKKYNVDVDEIFVSEEKKDSVEAEFDKEAAYEEHFGKKGLKYKKLVAVLIVFLVVCLIVFGVLSGKKEKLTEWVLPNSTENYKHLTLYPLKKGLKSELEIFYNVTSSDTGVNFEAIAKELLNGKEMNYSKTFYTVNKSNTDLIMKKVDGWVRSGKYGTMQPPFSISYDEVVVRIDPTKLKSNWVLLSAVANLNYLGSDVKVKYCSYFEDSVLIVENKIFNSGYKTAEQVIEVSRAFYKKNEGLIKSEIIYPASKDTLTYVVDKSGYVKGGFQNNDELKDKN